MLYNLLHMSRVQPQAAVMVILSVAAACFGCRYVVGLHEGDFPDALDVEPDDTEDISAEDTPDTTGDDPGDVPGDDPEGDPVEDPETEDGPSDPVLEDGPEPCGGSTSCPEGRACDRSSGVCVPEACAALVRIPEGSFIMGSEESSDPNARPEHEVVLAVFRITACEVTVAQYRACVDAGACTEPEDFGSATRASYFDSVEFDDFPAIHVAWASASAYCRWVGMRLPTEAEWEKAARGGCELGIDPLSCDDGDRIPYPWGVDDPDCSLSQFLPCTPDDTIACGSLTAGVSPYGIFDMAGNAAEWVQDWYAANYYAGPGPWIDPEGPVNGTDRVYRGGSFGSNAEAITVFNREHDRPVTAMETVGFRCAVSE